jgi:S-adenosylmethionine synthetase
MRLYLAGRATLRYRGVTVPIEAIAEETTANWVRANLRAVDPVQHLEVRPLIRAGSADLVELFLRQQSAHTPLANDSSIGVGFAPLTELERVVAGVEESLRAEHVRAASPELGDDIKILGVRRGDHIALTIACAFLGGLLPDMTAYLDAKERLRSAALDIARSQAAGPVSVDVNTADDPSHGSVYITVTGTSAEAGDDGQAGRGNRANGLITPFRPMTMESTAGKNPVSHVGKLYQIAAQRIAEALTVEIDGALGAECCLVSRIGTPLVDPQVVDIALELDRGASPARRAAAVERIARRELDRLPVAWREVVDAKAAV